MGESIDPRVSASVRVLAERIERFTPHDGVFPMRLGALTLFRISKPSLGRHHAVQKPGLCLIAQGSKSVALESEVFEYDESRMMVYTVDIPVGSCVVRASDDAPYLGLRLDLEPARIAELVPRVFPNGIPQGPEERAVSVASTDPDLVDAAARLISLMARASDVELIAPLVVDEILLRLLRGPQGPRVARIGFAQSRLHRIGTAVSWLRIHFAEAVEVERLAEMANMSASTFHQHFKAVTSMTPLQYQKTLRLQEARRSMLAEGADAGIAARLVGYASASQFSREYARQFGAPPLKDVARLREQMVVEPLEEVA